MIRIITDSASDITLEEATKMGITMIPMEVHFKDKTYLDGVDLNYMEFYRLLEKSSELPKTSQINPYSFEKEFKNIEEANDKAIVILVSSKLSGTYKNAKILESEYADSIYVIDSLTVSIGERILIYLAQKLINDGLNFEEIIKILEEKKKDIHFLAKLDTLKYLRKGGRISPLVAFGGELLNIKPIVGIVDGAVKLLGKGRGVANANKVINKLIIENGSIDTNYPFGTIFSGISSSILEKYIENSKELFPEIDEFKMYPLGCTIGTHIGPDGIGIAYFEKK